MAASAVSVLVGVAVAAVSLLVVAVLVAATVAEAIEAEAAESAKVLARKDLNHMDQHIRISVCGSACADRMCGSESANQCVQIRACRLTFVEQAFYT